MGDMAQWLTENWFYILTAACGIGGLWATAFAIHEDAKARRVANLLAITSNYREIWKEFFHAPALARVIDSSADVIKKPVTPAEELFVGLIISHINSVFYATNGKLVVKWEGLRRDVKEFFSLPVPKAVWNNTKLLQNQDFAAFIESSLKQS
jgi:hypothetical protein